MSYQENREAPAYPVHADTISGIGLTKRELIAAMALQGILSNHWRLNDYKNNIDAMGAEMAGKQAVLYADALLIELEK